MSQEDVTHTPLGFRPLYPDGRTFSDSFAPKYALVIGETEYLLSAGQVTLLLRGMLGQAVVELP